MDIAYDHVQEEALSPSEETPGHSTAEATAANLNADLQQAFQAVSASPWGSKLGGWFSQARQQGETLYKDLAKEAQGAQSQATQGWSTLREQVVSRTRGLSLDGQPAPEPSIPGEEAVPVITTTKPVDEKVTEHKAAEGTIERPESLPADIVKEAGTLVASLRTTATAKLKDLQKAEDAADEALLKFGTNLRNFLRDAVTISAPTDEDSSKPKGTDAAGNEVLFETQEAGTGRKVFHTTRLDAQLHAIHTTASSFTESPQGPQWDEWQNDFDIDKQTDAIAHDLDKYEELRRAMEKLVPEKLEYKVFWTRYYFLRKAIDEEEKRRKEVLKGATADSEEVAWDDDEEEEPTSTTPNTATTKHSNESATTLNAEMLTPKAPRRSHEDEIKSVAGSDASYDIVSGATTRAAGSPKDDKKNGASKSEESDDDDWE